MNTEKRLDYHRLGAEPLKHLYALSARFQESSIEPRLRYLIELRVSQINGCVYCVDMHSRQARSVGEGQQRLDCLPVWREAPFFSARERAALEWAETLTLISRSDVSDSLYEQIREYFSEQELTDLTLIVVTMNVWNRLAISFRQLPQPADC